MYEKQSWPTTNKCILIVSVSCESTGPTMYYFLMAEHNNDNIIYRQTKSINDFRSRRRVGIRVLTNVSALVHLNVSLEKRPINELISSSTTTFLSMSSSKSNAYDDEKWPNCSRRGTGVHDDRETKRNGRWTVNHLLEH